MKKTVVFGASPDPDRASFQAVERLILAGNPVVAFGRKPGQIAGVTISNALTGLDFSNVDTLSLYLSPANQIEYYDTLLGIDPKRIIFNPGTENPELKELAEKRVSSVNMLVLS